MAGVSFLLTLFGGRNVRGVGGLLGRERSKVDSPAVRRDASLPGISPYAAEVGSDEAAVAVPGTLRVAVIPLYQKIAGLLRAFQIVGGGTQKRRIVVEATDAVVAGRAEESADPLSAVAVVYRKPVWSSVFSVADYGLPTSTDGAYAALAFEKFFVLLRSNPVAALKIVAARSLKPFFLGEASAKRAKGGDILGAPYIGRLFWPRRHESDYSRECF